MILNIRFNNLINMMLMSTILSLIALQASISINNVFADNLCLGPLSCSAIGSNGGHGGNTGDAKGGDIGPGGSCYALDLSTIGDDCGGSTGSSEPRSGSGDNSMNGGNGGDNTINLNG